MNNTKKLPTTGIKPTIESFFAISVCHFRDQRECKASRFYYVVLGCQALNDFVIFKLIVSVTEHNLPTSYTPTDSQNAEK